MAHHTLKSGYAGLVERLNRFPQGAPPSDTLFKILAVLFSEKEAGLVSLLPIKPFKPAQAARAWQMNETAARKVLETLAGRAILVDVDGTYTLPPPMAGFFEFSMMRLRGDVDQKMLGELFYQYMNVEDEFIRALFTNGETQLGRVFVHEPALATLRAPLEVLDYERASEVIRTASCRGVGVCYCRHKMLHMERACKAPLNICMTFNSSAVSLTNNDFARRVDVAEGLDLLQEAYENNLVQFGENNQRGVNFICNCCGCCCEAMIAARRFGLLHPVHTTNYLPQVDEPACNGCTRCVSACPVEAMSLVSTNDPHHPNRKKAHVDESICLGCGVCVRTCTKQALALKPRRERVITPVNSVHRVVSMAVERGDLQNLIFDNQVLASHRALAAVLGAILKMPPVHRAMASQQMKSRYLLRLLELMKLA
jgi:Na+-translocating ferredoxin:NAD+ oxidoreductase RNF subunit RnfB